jgi:hypothetical protein
MHTTEGTQEIAHRCPHPFCRIDVYFADAIAVVITCPFFLAVTDRCVYANDVIVASPFVGEYHCIGQGESVNMVNQGLFVSVVNHSQAHLPALAADRADNGRSVIVVGAVSRPFIGPSTRWIIRISVKFAFFPPRSETSRLFQSADLAKDHQAAATPHWTGWHVAYREPFGARLRSRVPWSQSAHPCIPHEAAEWPVLAESAFPQTRSHCTGCRCLDKDTGIPSTGFSWLCGTHVPPPRSCRNVGISTRSGESTSTAKPRSARHRIGLQLESPYWGLYHTQHSFWT